MLPIDDESLAWCGARGFHAARARYHRQGPPQVHQRRLLRHRPPHPFVRRRGRNGRTQRREIASRLSVEATLDYLGSAALPTVVPVGLRESPPGLRWRPSSLTSGAPPSPRCGGSPSTNRCPPPAPSCERPSTSRTCPCSRRRPRRRNTPEWDPPLWPGCFPATACRWHTSAT